MLKILARVHELADPLWRQVRTNLHTILHLLLAANFHSKSTTTAAAATDNRHFLSSAVKVSGVIHTTNFSTRNPATYLLAYVQQRLGHTTTYFPRLRLPLFLSPAHAISVPGKDCVERKKYSLGVSPPPKKNLLALLSTYFHLLRKQRMRYSHFLIAKVVCRVTTVLTHTYTCNLHLPTYNVTYTYLPTCNLHLPTYM